MYNRRVSKTHPRVEAYGAVDELNAAVGMARAWSDDPYVRERLLTAQKQLVILMGELATAPSDLARYLQDGYQRVTADMTRVIDQWVAELEGRQVSFHGWATPGGHVVSAALDVARTTCRRAERRACGLREAGELDNAEVLIYLNRLSDALWLLARWVETDKPGAAPGGTVV